MIIVEEENGSLHIYRFDKVWFFHHFVNKVLNEWVILMNNRVLLNFRQYFIVLFIINIFILCMNLTFWCQTVAVVIAHTRNLLNLVSVLIMFSGWMGCNIFQATLNCLWNGWCYGQVISAIYNFGRINNTEIANSKFKRYIV